MSTETSTTSVLPKKTVFVDQDQNTALHHAAALGSAQEVLKCIHEGQKVDAENYLGWTPLMMAARNGRTEVVMVLLEQLADSTRCNHFGFSVFLMAVVNGKLDLIHLLLGHLLSGGVSKQHMESHFSPISLSILLNNRELLFYLTEQSFCVNKSAPLTGITPIMFATQMGNTDFINYLISQGAQPTKDVFPHAPVSLQSTHHRSPLPVILSSSKTAAHLPYSIPELIPDNHIHHSSNCFAVSQFPLELSPIPLIPTHNPVGLEESVLQPEGLGVSPIVLIPTPNNTPRGYYANKLHDSRISSFLCLMPSPGFSVSPITPLHYSSQQVFFPPDFSISHLQPHQHVGLDFVEPYGKMHSSNLSPYMYQYCANAWGQRPSSA